MSHFDKFFNYINQLLCQNVLNKFSIETRVLNCLNLFGRNIPLFRISLVEDFQQSLIEVIQLFNKFHIFTFQFWFQRVNFRNESINNLVVLIFVDVIENKFFLFFKLNWVSRILFLANVTFKTLFFVYFLWRITYCLF